MSVHKLFQWLWQSFIEALIQICIQFLKLSVQFGDGHLWRPEVAVFQIQSHYLSVCNTPSSGVLVQFNMYRTKFLAGHYFIYFLHSKCSTHVKKLMHKVSVINKCVLLCGHFRSETHRLPGLLQKLHKQICCPDAQSQHAN